MALITCKECKKQVSDNAKKCPGCGAPVPQPTSRLAIFIAGVFGLIVFSSVYNSGSSTASNVAMQSAPTPSKPAFDCIKDEVEILAFVKSRINDFPNSALEVLRPCEKITGNTIYTTQILEAEKSVKINKDKEIKRMVDMEKTIKIDAVKEAKRKKTEGVKIGMTMDDVVASSWGKPNRINRTTSTRGTREQWVYGNNHYLYFDENILTSIQN